jgi:hypothetical protein
MFEHVVEMFLDCGCYDVAAHFTSQLGLVSAFTYLDDRFNLVGNWSVEKVANSHDSKSW